jgi:hypothetical protein
MENDILRLKLEKFITGKIPIHIVLKKKFEHDFPRFLNGVLIGKKIEDVYILEERKIGRTYVLLEDIYDVNVFMKGNSDLIRDIKDEVRFSIGEGVSMEELDINLIKDIKDEDI